MSIFFLIFNSERIDLTTHYLLSILLISIEEKLFDSYKNYWVLLSALQGLISWILPLLPPVTEGEQIPHVLGPPYLHRARNLGSPTPLIIGVHPSVQKTSSPVAASQLFVLVPLPHTTAPLLKAPASSNIVDSLHCRQHPSRLWWHHRRPRAGRLLDHHLWHPQLRLVASPSVSLNLSPVSL